MKKINALVLGLALTVSTLAGCSKTVPLPEGTMDRLTAAINKAEAAAGKAEAAAKRAADAANRTEAAADKATGGWKAKYHK